MTAAHPLVAALRAEFAAVYLYGLIAGRASHGGHRDEIARLEALYAAHRLRRDQLVALITARQLTPPAPAVAYRPPVDPVSPSTRTACARDVEVRCETVYAQLVGATTGTERAFAIAALSATSSAAVTLGQPRRAFPGLTV
ncbi:MAG: DUF4439 domain-containing protein [Marmoricola sp.]